MIDDSIIEFGLQVQSDVSENDGWKAAKERCRNIDSSGRCVAPV